MSKKKTLAPIPKQIKVGAAVYDVEQKESLNAERAAEINFKKLKIEIEKDMPRLFQKDCIMHETLHAVLWNCGESELCANESFVVSIASNLTAVFNDNPQLCDYLKGD